MILRAPPKGPKYLVVSRRGKGNETFSLLPGSPSLFLLKVPSNHPERERERDLKLSSPSRISFSCSPHRNPINSPVQPFSSSSSPARGRPRKVFPSGEREGFFPPPPSHSISLMKSFLFLSLSLSLSPPPFFSFGYPHSACTGCERETSRIKDFIKEFSRKLTDSLLLLPRYIISLTSILSLKSRTQA